MREELDSAIQTAVAENRTRKAALEGLTFQHEANGVATVSSNPKQTKKRSIIVRLIRFGRRSPGVGAAVGACIGFLALQGATYLQERWKNDASGELKVSEQELVEWFRMSGSLAPPNSATEAAKFVKRLEFELRRFSSPSVRSKVIELTEYYRIKQQEFEAAETQAAQAAVAASAAQEQVRQAQQALLQAKDANAAEDAKKAAEAAEKAAQLAKQQAIEAEKRTSEIRDSIRANRLNRLGVY